ncbi:hypothetical protein D3C78_1214320 [compost metagenome]
MPANRTHGVLLQHQPAFGFRHGHCLGAAFLVGWVELAIPIVRGPHGYRCAQTARPDPSYKTAADQRLALASLIWLLSQPPPRAAISCTLAVRRLPSRVRTVRSLFNAAVWVVTTLL